jgi:hypothetical protein
MSLFKRFFGKSKNSAKDHDHIEKICEKQNETKKAGDIDTTDSMDMIEKQSKEIRARIDEMKIISPDRWIGLVVSKHGDFIREVYGSMPEITVGKWLYFAFDIETQPDRRIIFSDIACFWLNATKPIKIKTMGNMFRPIPEDIEHFLIKDENYSEWRKAFQAVDEYFAASEISRGWRNQWSWRTDRVKHFMNGQISNWISSHEINPEPISEPTSPVKEKSKEIAVVTCPSCKGDLSQTKGSPISPYINLYSCKNCGWESLKCGKTDCDGYMNSERLRSSDTMRYECVKCGWSCTGKKIQ